MTKVVLSIAGLTPPMTVVRVKAGAEHPGPPRLIAVAGALRNWRRRFYRRASGEACCTGEGGFPCEGALGDLGMSVCNSGDGGPAVAGEIA